MEYSFLYINEKIDKENKLKKIGYFSFWYTSSISFINTCLVNPCGNFGILIPLNLSCIIDKNYLLSIFGKFFNNPNISSLNANGHIWW